MACAVGASERSLYACCTATATPPRAPCEAPRGADARFGRGAVSVPRFHAGQFLGRGSTKTATVQLRHGALLAALTSRTTDLTREAMLMMKVSAHPHLLPLLGLDRDPLSNVRILVPIAPFGSILDLVDHLEFEGASLDPMHVAAVLLQVAHALVHLRTHGVDHGDVAARNVFVFQFQPGEPTIQARLGDYGEARRSTDRALCMRGLAAELYGLVPR